MKTVWKKNVSYNSFYARLYIWYLIPKWFNINVREPCELSRNHISKETLFHKEHKSIQNIFSDKFFLLVTSRIATANKKLESVWSKKKKTTTTVDVANPP